MTQQLPRTHRLLLVFMLALASLSAAGPAHATALPPRHAWHLAVTFPNNQLQVIYTRYTTSGDPLNVVQINQFDLSASCQILGALSFDVDGYAIFDGQTAIRCPLPQPPAGLQGPREPTFWMGADVRLNAQAAHNPLIEGRQGNTSAFLFGMPHNGTSAQARVRLHGQQFNSTPWLPGLSNQVALGAGGENIGKIADALANEDVAVLDYVPAWRAFFDSLPADDTVSQIHQPSGSTWTSSQSLNSGLWSHPSEVFIGYSPTSGKFFEGGLRSLEVDPPGCRTI